MHLQSKGDGVRLIEGSRGTFVDCDLRENSLAGIGVHDGSNPTFRVCRITAGKGAAGDGVWLAQQSLGLFEECVIEANTSSGVTILNGSNPTFRRCRITGNVGPGILSREAGKGVVEESDVLRNRGGSIVMQDTARVTVRASRTD